jgi:cell division protein FtsB
MTRAANETRTRVARSHRLLALVAFACLGAAAVPAVVSAQGFNWPWDQPAPKKPPAQPAPAWRPPPEAGPQPNTQPAPYAGAGQKSSICLQLEQRLVQEGQRGNQSRDLVPMVESQLRQVDKQWRTSAQTLERSDCYDYFFFSKTLKRTKKCVELARETDALKRQLTDLETQRQQLSASTGQSYQDEIIRELARNNCGQSYQQQAARRDDSNPFSSLWSEDGDSGGGGLGGSFKSLPYATYRTMCVRLCDGYYFPISFSTLPNHFQRDAEACQSKCAAPTELFYYQNPGGAVEQMVGSQSNALYTQLNTAFRYRKEYVQGCSCKQAEYLPQTPVPQQQGSNEQIETGTPAQRAQASEPATSGWTSDVKEQ